MSEGPSRLVFGLALQDEIRHNFSSCVDYQHSKPYCAVICARISNSSDMT